MPVARVLVMMVALGVAVCPMVVVRVAVVSVAMLAGRVFVVRRRAAAPP